MGLLINIPDRNVDKLVAKLSEHIKSSEIYVYPDTPVPSAIEFALVWKHEPGSLSKFSNIRGISSFGAGVDAILSDSELPNVPIARIVDNDLANNMANFVSTIINSYRLRLHDYSQQQTLALWKPRSPRKEKKVGILGLGELGQATALQLKRTGFEVTGWSQSVKKLDGVECLTGRAGFDEIIATSDYLVCLLPLTPLTKGILNESVFDKMKPSSVLVNVARGAHIVEQDLISALYDKSIAHAFLDVFEEEPLPEQHPYWRTPNISITPHVSAVTNIDTAVTQIVSNYNNVKNNKAMVNTIDVYKGY